MPRPAPGTYPAYFQHYINLVQADSVAEIVDKYQDFIVQFFRNIPVEKAGYSYAPGKWSTRVLLQHIIDAERIFGFRALSIARQDQTPLPGFDEVAYANASNADTRSWESLLEEFEIVRKGTDLLLLSFTADQLLQTGTTNEHTNTVTAISFVIFGHILHHINILQERYL